jgi:hypothetical protein
VAAGVAIYSNVPGSIAGTLGGASNPAGPYASPNYILAIYDCDGSRFNLTGPPGSAQVGDLFQDFFRFEGLNIQRLPSMEDRSTRLSYSMVFLLAASSPVTKASRP